MLATSESVALYRRQISMSLMKSVKIDAVKVKLQQLLGSFQNVRWQMMGRKCMLFFGGKV